MIAIINIQTGGRITRANAPPVRTELPDGGLAEFRAVGDERPAHRPIYRCVESVEVTTPPEYPHTVTGETREVVDGREEISRTYAPDQTAYQRAIEAHIDAVAQSRGYMSGVSISRYGFSTVPAWKAEADAFNLWLDAVWVYALGELAAVQQGSRTPPPLADFIAELPQINWGS